MTDLVEFLRARFDELEAKAIQARDGERTAFVEADDDIVPLLFNEGKFDLPARMLREVERDRRIIDEHYPVYAEKACRRCSDFAAPGEILHAEPSPCLTLQLLALPYADHPAYRDEWRAKLT